MFMCIHLSLQDGGYNKPIPAQYEANLNRSVTSEATSNDTSATSDEPSVLCATCQQNQLLKVKQLANFVPFNEVRVMLQP